MFKKSISKILLAVIFFGLLASFSYATETDIGSSEFELNVDIFTPGSNRGIGSSNPNAVDGANFALGYIIERLMLFIGGLALLVMTIGSGFMILHRGDDASLSKGKEIFMAGILGLAVALFSYLMVSLIRYLIYSI